MAKLYAGSGMPIPNQEDINVGNYGWSTTELTTVNTIVELLSATKIVLDDAVKNWQNGQADIAFIKQTMETLQIEIDKIEVELPIINKIKDDIVAIKFEIDNQVPVLEGLVNQINNAITDAQDIIFEISDDAVAATEAARQATDAKDLVMTTKANIDSIYASMLTIQTDATAAVNKAKAWAENPEDTPIETGKYSAKHWAAKAKEAADNAASGGGTVAGVSSINGSTGAVILTAADVGAVATTGSTITGNITLTSTGAITAQSSQYVLVPDAQYARSATPKTYVDGLDSANVKLTGTQAIGGTKVFTGSVEVPTPLDGPNATTKTYVDGLDAANVKLTGDQTIAGNKTFTGNVSLGQGLVTYDKPPAAPNQITNKNYVDYAIGQALGNVDASSYVTKDTAQTITGAKTFNANLSVSGAAANFATATSVSVPTPIVRTEAANKGYVDDAIANASLGGGSIDTSRFVSTDGTQTITGFKTLTGGIVVNNAPVDFSAAQSVLVPTPLVAHSAVSKSWVENAIASTGGGSNSYPIKRDVTDLFETVSGSTYLIHSLNSCYEFPTHYDCVLFFDTTAKLNENANLLLIKVPHKIIIDQTGSFGSASGLNPVCAIFTSDWMSSTGNTAYLTCHSAIPSGYSVRVRLIMEKY